MSYAAARIDEFHEAFGVPGEKTPGEITRGRQTLHEEEHVEVAEALEALAETFELIEASKAIGVAQPKPQAHLEHVAEELADELVVLYGTANVLGIDLDTAFAIKMNANMAKLPECASCDGTGRKPRGTLLGHVEGRQRIETGFCHGCGGTGKGEPIKREGDQKILKPEGWQKPSFAEAIR